MKWPKLVPSAICNTAVRVYQTCGIEENGGEKRKLIFDGKCNYSEKARQIMTAEKQLVQLNAQALFDGDICFGEDISGEIVVHAGSVIRRRIYRFSRGRNPDGTVNFTCLELI